MAVIAEQLALLIHQKLELYDRLMGLLEDEKAALVDSDIGRLEQSTEAKTLLVQLLADCANQTAQLYKSDPVIQNHGMETFLAMQGNSDDVRAWQQLQILAELAQEQNRLNGMIINQLSTRTQNAINLLQGQDNRDTALYDPKGQNTLSQRKRTIIS